MIRARRRRPPMPRRRHLSVPLVAVALVGGWEAVTTAGWIPPVVLPKASETVRALGALLSADWFPRHLLATTIETALGFALATTVAVLTATVMHLDARVRRVLYPYVILFKLIPAVVLAPVFVIWFGFGITPKVVVAASIAYFAVVIAALAGFDAVDRELRVLMTSIGATRWQMFRMVAFPSALPYIFAGMKTGVTLALVGALVAEFISANAGLGYLLIQFGYTFQHDMLFATIGVVGGVGLVSFGAIALIERRLVWW